MAIINAVGLCRVSTHRQSNENNSLAKQRANIDAAAEQLGANIVKYWEVSASSKKGRNMQRKDLREMLAYCSKRSNKVQYCIIDEVDRFMRSIGEYYRYKGELEECGVRLIFAKEPSLTDGSQIATLKEMLAIYHAETDNTHRSEKVISHMQATLARGYWPFPVKPGYQRTFTAGLHEPDPERFPLLQKAIRMVIARTHTVKEAQVWLRDNGYATASGNALGLDKFATILKEPYYCGLLKAKDWPVHMGLHTPMVSQEEFDQLQIIVSGRTVKKRNRHYNPNFPGQKLLSCGECNTAKRTTGSSSSNGHGGKFARYYCMNCKKYWNRDKVHSAVEDFLSKVTLTDAARSELSDALISVWRKKNSDRRHLIASLNTKINSLKQTKTDLTLSYATASQTMKIDIEAEIDNIRTQIDSYEQRKQILLQDDREIEKFIRFAFNYLSELCSKWWSLEPEQREWCQKIIFPGEIMLHDKYKIGTTKLSPIFTLQNTKSSPKAANDIILVELPGTAPGSER